MFFVNEHGGAALRMVLDYRWLNEKIKRNSTSLPHFDELIGEQPPVLRELLSRAHRQLRTDRAAADGSHDRLRTALIHEAHDGHMGIITTHERLAQELCWPLMHKDVNDDVASCSKCLTNKPINAKPAGQLAAPRGAN